MADMKNLLVDVVKKYNQQEEVLSNVTASLVKDTIIEDIVSTMDDIMSTKYAAERAFEKVESLIETYQLTEFSLSAALINQVYLRGRVSELKQYHLDKVSKLNFIQIDDHLTSYVEFIKATLSDMNLLYPVGYMGSPSNISDIDRMTRFVMADMYLMDSEIQHPELNYGLQAILAELGQSLALFDGTAPMPVVKQALEGIYTKVPSVQALYEGVNVFYSENLEFRMKAILEQIETYRENIINTVKSQIEIEKAANHRDSEQIIDMYNQIIRIQTYTSNNIDTVLGVYPLNNEDIRKFVDNLGHLDTDMQSILYILNERNTQKLVELEEYKDTTMRTLGYIMPDSEKVPPFSNLTALMDNYEGWLDGAMSLELFNSAAEADKYLCKFLIKDHDYLGRKYKAVFSRNLFDLRRLYEREYALPMSTVRMSSTIAASLSMADFTLTNTKTFFISLLFPDINVFFGKTIDDIIDPSTGEILIEKDFLFAITRSFVIMSKEQKMDAMYKMVNFVVDHSREDDFKDFSECVFSHLIMSFLEAVSMTSDLDEDIVSNIEDILSVKVQMVRSYIDAYRTLYRSIMVEKRLPSFDQLNYFDDQKQSQWFGILSTTVYAPALTYLAYNPYADYSGAIQ